MPQDVAFSDSAASSGSAGTVIDLRSEQARAAQPLRLPSRVLAVSLAQIEDGVHGLTPDLGPLLVVCERGARSGLAARLLRADGLDAQAYAGGVGGLLAAEQDGALPDLTT
ncbi:rhodanese-like domain-containing protein [Deinococcus sp. KNUC1210]|uniref:rhodanese-like domain-containing protein n=1 Tax=Deinococcus sp. KNUC1210 TaxID=2917691 RepID=UPI001EF0F4A4|nr:rhodanese-like domain-containing protein [Deinococcus sp. KNUC1210]ULH15809.1 rhodanese-like domain-containing protein [Deinococcus sp. KNUC1210]